MINPWQFCAFFIWPAFTSVITPMMTVVVVLLVRALAVLVLWSVSIDLLRSLLGCAGPGARVAILTA